MWWGLLSAAMAACAYGTASAMQALAAARANAGTSDRPLPRMLRQWQFIAGIGLDLLGFTAQFLALRVLPLFVVQAALATSLAVTAVVASRVLATRLHQREWYAILIVVSGLITLGLTASAEGHVEAGATLRFALIGAVVALVIAGTLAQRLDRRTGTAALGLVAGLGFGLIAIASRVITDLRPTALLTDPAFYALLGAGATAFLFYASALQRGTVTVATTMLVLGETVVPALIGMLLLGDRTRPGLGPIAILGFALAITGATMLARFGDPERLTASQP
jgi:drug/metabolite transporter (DMT)-like permease